MKIDKLLELVQEYQKSTDKEQELKERIKDAFTDTLDNWIDIFNKKLENNDDMILVKFMIPYYHSRMDLYTVNVYIAIIDKKCYLENQELFTHYKEIKSKEDVIKLASGANYYTANKEHWIFDNANIFTLSETVQIADYDHGDIKEIENKEITFTKIDELKREVYIHCPLELRDIVLEVVDEKLSKPKVLKKIK